MAIAVEHEERRKQILEKALMVFVSDGFEDATFQKIADQCGITRTILYLYFKNKKEIFNYSIKQLLINVEERINTIRHDKSLNSTDRITDVLLAVFSLLEQNRQLLSIIFDYLLHFSKNNISPEEYVRRRTVRLRHILSSMVIEGVKAGEIKDNNVKTVDDYIYSFIESAIYQLVILKRKDMRELKNTVVFAIKQLVV
jgi:AcrR family transcriptional regulator